MAAAKVEGGNGRAKGEGGVRKGRAKGGIGGRGEKIDCGKFENLLLHQGSISLPAALKQVLQAGIEPATWGATINSPSPLYHLSYWWLMIFGEKITIKTTLFF